MLTDEQSQALKSAKHADELIGWAALSAAAKMADCPQRQNLRTTANLSKVRIQLIEGLLND
jgi:hypothetical protein